MKISEYVSGIEGVFNEDFGAVLQEVGVDGSYMLQAESAAGWQFGIIASGECPQIDGVTGDKTWVCKVYIAADDEDSLLFECAAARISCVGLGSGTWRPSVKVFKVGSTVTLPGTSVLDVDTVYYLAATHELATGDIKIHLRGIEDNSVGGSDNVPTINALPVWVMGAPPGSWVADCAVFSRILAPEEMPGYLPPPTVTINKAAAQADPAGSSPILFTVVFSEAVTGFATGDVTLSGTASATTAVVTETGPMDGTTYTVSVSGMTDPGTVIASINAGVCTSVATGAANAASTSTDNNVFYFQFPSGLAAWFDAADSSSITQASGAVSQWNDKSGNAHHVSQSVAGSKPTTGAATINGRNVISFDGGDFLFNTSPWMRNSVSAKTYFAVIRGATGGAQAAILAEGRSSDTNPYYMPVYVTSDEAAWTKRDNTGAPSVVQQSSGIDVFDSAAHVIATTDSTTAVTQAVDDNAGTGVGSYSRTTATLDRFAIGALIRTTVSNHLTGDIAEILVFDSVLSSGDIDDIENYLAAKWGITL